jgi:hypothetical protein
VGPKTTGNAGIEAYVYCVRCDLEVGEKFLFGSIGERQIVKSLRKQPSDIGLLYFSEINMI